MADKYTIYEKRQINFGYKVVSPKFIHDGDGKIFIVGQVEVPGDSNPKACRIWLANNDGSITSLVTIKEIYAWGELYLREDGLAIVEGMDHDLHVMTKVNIPDFVPRPDAMVSTWKRWRAYFLQWFNKVV